MAQWGNNGWAAGQGWGAPGAWGNPPWTPENGWGLPPAPSVPNTTDPSYVDRTIRSRTVRGLTKAGDWDLYDENGDIIVEQAGYAFRVYSCLLDKASSWFHDGGMDPAFVPDADKEDGVVVIPIPAHSALDNFAHPQGLRLVLQHATGSSQLMAQLSRPGKGLTDSEALSALFTAAYLGFHKQYIWAVRELLRCHVPILLKDYRTFKTKVSLFDVCNILLRSGALPLVPAALFKCSTHSRNTIQMIPHHALLGPVISTLLEAKTLFDLLCFGMWRSLVGLGRRHGCLDDSLVEEVDLGFEEAFRRDDSTLDFFDLPKLPNGFTTLGWWGTTAPELERVACDDCFSRFSVDLVEKQVLFWKWLPHMFGMETFDDRYPDDYPSPSVRSVHHELTPECNPAWNVRFCF